ncbi:hypothetical protein O9X98_08165 [Agrobacterium salinitolerans]|nr:hypothetical protein [Agrobacterium salinitolerans]
MTTKPNEHDEVGELLDDLARDPMPAERWFPRDDFDPMYKLSTIDAAVRKGYIETEGSRSSAGFRMRITRLGRCVAEGTDGSKVKSDGLSALERMTTAAKLAFIPHDPWTVQNGCSWTRIGTQGEDGNILRPTVAQDGVPDIVAAHGVLDYLMAAQPREINKVAALVADMQREIDDLRRQLAAADTPASTTEDQLAGTNLEALRELGKYKGGPYWWRQASMKKLLGMGLVEAWHPERKLTKRMAHRMTAKGVDALNEIDGRK